MLRRIASIIIRLILIIILFHGMFWIIPRENTMYKGNFGLNKLPS